MTLDEFMYRFGYRSLAFALEIKEEGVEEDTLHTVKAYGAEEKCIFTSFCYTSLMRIRRLDPHAHLGYLVKSVSEQVIREAKAIQCEQLCPHISSLNQEMVRQLKEMGFSIRAWGISDETVMKQCLSYGVDGGMTINFPDKLTKALGETLC